MICTRGWLLGHLAAGGAIERWITCGADRLILGQPDPIRSARRGWRGLTRSRTLARRVARRLVSERPMPTVPWTNIYRPGDLLGAALPGADNVALPPHVPASLADHFYWDAPDFAAAVAAAVRRT